MNEKDEDKEREREREKTFGKLIFAILVLRNWLLMFYSFVDNGERKRFSRGKVVSPPGQGSRISSSCPCRVLVLLKGIASLTGVKSTLPGAVLLALAIDRYFVVFALRTSRCPLLFSFLSSFHPSFFSLSSCRSSVCYPLLVTSGARSSLPVLSATIFFFRVHHCTFFFATFSHKDSRAHLSRVSLSSWTSGCSPGDIPSNLFAAGQRLLQRNTR